MKILCVLSKYDFGKQERGVSTEYIMFYDALLKMGHEVELFDFYTILNSSGKAEMNEMLIKKIELTKPDLVFTYLIKNEIETNTLKIIKEQKITKTLVYFGDDEWRYENFSSVYAPYFDYIVTTDPDSIEKYRKINCLYVLYQRTGANHRVFKKKNCEKDIKCSYVGAARLDRVKFINKLRKQKIDIKCWGTGWNVSFFERVINKIGIGRNIFEKKYAKTRLSFEEMCDIFNRSKINLCTSESFRGDIKQIKARVFEVTASGGFLLCEHVKGIEDFFILDEEIVCYNSFDDLISKIGYYLENDEERNKIALNGYKRTLSQNTAEIRLKEIFHWIEQTNSSFAKV